MRWAELIVCDLCDDYVVSDSFWQKSAVLFEKSLGCSGFEKLGGGGEKKKKRMN